MERWDQGRVWSWKGLLRLSILMGRFFSSLAGFQWEVSMTCSIPGHPPVHSVQKVQDHGYHSDEGVNVMGFDGEYFDVLKLDVMPHTEAMSLCTKVEWLTYLLEKWWCEPWLRQRVMFMYFQQILWPRWPSVSCKRQCQGRKVVNSIILNGEMNVLVNIVHMVQQPFQFPWPMRSYQRGVINPTKPARGLMGRLSQCFLPEILHAEVSYHMRMQ